MADRAWRRLESSHPPSSFAHTRLASSKSLIAQRVTYSALVQQLGRGIFGPEDRLEPYYYASSAHYRLEFLFRNGTISSALKPAQYHILMAARLVLHPGSLPRSNSHDMAKLGSKLMDAIWKPSSSDELLVKAAKIVDATAAGNFHRDHIRTQPFPEAVKKACGAA